MKGLEVAPAPGDSRQEMPRSTASDTGPSPSLAVSGTNHPPSRGAPSGGNSMNAMKDYSSAQKFITSPSYELYALNIIKDINSKKIQLKNDTFQLNLGLKSCPFRQIYFLFSEYKPFSLDLGR